MNIDSLIGGSVAQAAKWQERGEEIWDIFFFCELRSLG